MLIATRQCIVSVWGGKVDMTGEILHGKTSQLQHDGQGLYEGLRQNFPVTRYHSLAGMRLNLPNCLEISSWTAAQSEKAESIIMGVRHKKWCIEGVQFHPESITTAEGRKMLSNFLRRKDGEWAKDELHRSLLDQSLYISINGENGKQAEGKFGFKRSNSILSTIFEHRMVIVSTQKERPGLRLQDLQSAMRLALDPPLISFPDRLLQSHFPLSLMAEMKRASPSKGVIAPATSAPEQALKYVQCGASVISVLTEPEWFKGDIEDLKSVRKCLNGIPNRPAVLRKDFIFDEYQILEARLAGADTILLIVKMLETATLEILYQYSKSLGMEPLVEVNNEEEMYTAIKLGSKVIGINNRNLNSFDVDLNTTSRLISLAPKGTIICALSGIKSAADVQHYYNTGVRAILIGESLMCVENLPFYTSKIFDVQENADRDLSLLTKICGTRSVEAARAAVESGADLVGIILADGRKRSVTFETAKKISQAVRATTRPQRNANDFSSFQVAKSFHVERSKALLLHPTRALIVGVFQNQPLDHILRLQRLLELDVVQLHGAEPIEWASLIPVPVVRSFKPENIGISRKGYHLALLDSSDGGAGKAHNLEDVKALLARNSSINIILAGGLDPENVSRTLQQLHEFRDQIFGVDVSSGIESDGHQSLEKIKKFVSAVKSF